MEDLMKRRVRRLRKLIEEEGDPFRRTTYERTALSNKINESYDELKSGKGSGDVERVAGRLTSIRVHGGVAFADLTDPEGSIQLFFRRDNAKKPFHKLEEFLDEGDIVGASGEVVRTKRGEISLRVEKIQLLSKALRPLPSEWYGLKNVETRYRQRYLDLAMNPKVRENFKVIGGLLTGLREYLLDEDFTEVQTPILQPIYGGAYAEPFKTHHNYLDQDMFLRIAPELYLKRLIVGGLERVFEVAPCFRNESVDSRHNPEFSQVEAYQAFADYNDMMELVENMVHHAVEAATGESTVEYQGKEIDLSPPWRRLSMEAALAKKGIELDKMSDEQILKKAKGLGTVRRVGDAIEALFEEHVQDELIQPTFITDFPVDISPLAKRDPDSPKRAQRFEVYIGGEEVGNAYSELNNPVEQFLRFQEEEEHRDGEHMPMDKDYVRALEYGMPPTGGLGIGIARLASIVLDSPSIKEVLLFPAMAGIEDIETAVERFPELADLFKDTN